MSKEKPISKQIVDILDEFITDVGDFTIWLLEVADSVFYLLILTWGIIELFTGAVLVAMAILIFSQVWRIRYHTSKKGTA